jgi:hypothetical protein
MMNPKTKAIFLIIVTELVSRAVHAFVLLTVMAVLLPLLIRTAPESPQPESAAAPQASHAAPIQVAVNHPVASRQD